MSTPDQSIDYYFSVMSPWAYLGDARFSELAKKHKLKIRYHPLLSPDLFPATGGQLLKDRAQPRKDNRLTELKRWRDHLGLKINLQPKHFPTPEHNASQLILATQDPGPLTHAIMRAVWEEDKDISDLDTLSKIADHVGLKGAELVSSSQTQAYATAVKAETEAAIAAGVFGYPTYVYQNELFWGQDRLDFLSRALGT